jgi:SWI/SNF chromatin-remodeling complex subunit SWI1
VIYILPFKARPDDFVEDGYMDCYPLATGEMPYNTNNNKKRCIKETCMDNNQWGNVDTEALTMSIRSRLSTELSYALMTFTLLSTMRGQTAGSRFPIFQCVDLLDEMLDLLMDQVFDSAEDLPESIGPDNDPYITTNQELVNTVYKVESQPFAVLQYHQGSKDPDLGPRQQPANVMLAIINIIRTIPDNLEFISRHQRLVDLILCVCRVVQVKGGPPSAASSILSLGDLVTVHKDTLYTLTNIAGLIQFSSNAAPSEATLRMANQAFQLIASYFFEPTFERY